LEKDCRELGAKIAGMQGFVARTGRINRCGCLENAKERKGFAVLAREW